MPNEILKETLTKYVDAKLYDINVLYEAIASRATVSLDVLRSCVNDVHVPYLKRTYGIRKNPYYKVTGYFDEDDEMDMETFIRRVPFIFYIYSNKEKGLYADFNSLHSSLMNYSNCGKLDTLFTMLEKLFYTYELSLETIFSYVLRQFGTLDNFEDFENWFNYVELTHKNGGVDYEPKNLLYSYNELLVDSGGAPFRYTIKSYRRVDREIIVNGNLPYDFDKNTCDFTWILLWINNAKDVYIEPTGDTELQVMIKNKYDLADFTLTITYPEGITPKTGRGVAPTVVNDNLYSTKYGSVTPLTMSQTINSQTVTYKVNNSQTDTYLAKQTPYVAFTLPVTVSGENALYNIKATVGDLTVYNTTVDQNATSPITVKGGEFMTSLFLGKPTQTDPIVYGHYTTEGQAALKAVSTNFASIDMSEATLDATEADVAADLTGKLIYGPENTSYNRSVTGYGTVCLPFELTSNDNVQYYTLKSGTTDKLIFEEVNKVPAHTPALVKGNIVVSADGYNYADPAATLDGASANGLTMKGTYKKIKLEEGEGYYIADNKFWHDWATIAPFRGYLTGTISGSSKLSILIDDATGLHEITDQLSSEDIYNLQGIKLSKTQKGVNIIGGKKILVK